MRAGSSAVRAAQTGFLRYYALLIVVGHGRARLLLPAERMTVHLSIVLFLPLAFGVLGLLAPPKLAGRIALLGTALVLAYAVVLIVDFDSGAPGLQYVTDETWISELGISYKLGIDGLNLLLIALTAILWFSCTLWAGLREWERSRLFYFHLLLAETAVLGALMAQDLALFVVFFDLMLVPFFFLTGQWGEGRRVQATMKLVIYTLVGSLLMLTAAIATGVLAAPGSQRAVVRLLRSRPAPAVRSPRRTGSSCSSRPPSS